MELKGSQTYEYPIATVLDMLRNPDATVAKYESMKHRNVEITECKEEGNVLRIVSSRIVDVDLPGFAKRVLKPTNTMRQTDEWTQQEDGSSDGTFDVEVQGAPIHISGRMHLEPDGETTKHDVTIKVDVKVPIIGGRIADWAAGNDVKRNLEGEFSFNSAWLASHAHA